MTYPEPVNLTWLLIAHIMKYSLHFFTAYKAKTHELFNSDITLQPSKLEMKLDLLGILMQLQFFVAARCENEQLCNNMGSLLN